MKRTILSLTLVLGCGLLGFGQEPQKVSPMKIYRMEPANTQTEPAKMTTEEEIKYCKDMLEALDAKEAWIRSNPEETKKAEESGWFVNAEAERKKLRARLEELQN